MRLLTEDTPPIIYKDVHNDLLINEIWGEVKDGEFVGVLAFSVDLSSSENDVSAYTFNVLSMVEDLIESYEMGTGEMLSEEGKEKAEFIIADMKKMIRMLENRI